MTDTQRPVTVVAVDDHTVVIEGLRAFFDTYDDIELVGEAGDGEEALEIVDRVEPDVVLMDLVMPQLDGPAAIRRLQESHPDIPVLALTSFSDRDRVLGAVQAGADGYVLKDVDPQQLVAAIRSVASGQAYLQSEVTDHILDEVVSAEPVFEGPYGELTPREQDVLGCIARGRTNSDIAEELYISEKTVKTHVSNILGKLGVDDRTQAALFAVRRGWISPAE